MNWRYVSRRGGAQLWKLFLVPRRFFRSIQSKNETKLRRKTATQWTLAYRAWTGAQTEWMTGLNISYSAYDTQCRKYTSFYVSLLTLPCKVYVVAHSWNIYQHSVSVHFSEGKKYSYFVSKSRDYYYFLHDWRWFEAKEGKRAAFFRRPPWASCLFLPWFFLPLLLNRWSSH